jgi:hypothetical protein
MHRSVVAPDVLWSTDNDSANPDATAKYACAEHWRRAMSKFDVPIDKQATCDATINEVLKSVELQTKSHNHLVDHQVQTTKVILTYQGQ